MALAAGGSATRRVCCPIARCPIQSALRSMMQWAGTAPRSRGAVLEVAMYAVILLSVNSKHLAACLCWRPHLRPASVDTLQSICTGLFWDAKLLLECQQLACSYDR